MPGSAGQLLACMHSGKEMINSLQSTVAKIQHCRLCLLNAFSNCDISSQCIYWDLMPYRLRKIWNRSATSEFQFTRIENCFQMLCGHHCHFLLLILDFLFSLFIIITYCIQLLFSGLSEKLPGIGDTAQWHSAFLAKYEVLSLIPSIALQKRKEKNSHLKLLQHSPSAYVFIHLSP